MFGCVPVNAGQGRKGGIKRFFGKSPYEILILEDYRKLTTIPPFQPCV